MKKIRCGKPMKTGVCARYASHKGKCASESALANRSEAMKKYVMGKPDYDGNKTNRDRRAFFSDVINEYKIQAGCERCGYNEHAVALDLDHRNPLEKLFNISQQLHQLDPKNLEDLERLVTEVRKCRVLCSNCHRVKTLEAGENKRGVRDAA